MVKARIVVTLIIEGIHNYPKASGNENYLRFPHRHLFKIICTKDVSHLDRDIEIIDFKHLIKAYIDEKYKVPANFGELSCEMIALELATQFKCSRCIVLEDGENGAEVEL